jgi:glycosyltransferase involved in cell wall biosynthesis
MTKPRVLAFVDYYLPGFKAGGPIPSVSRIIEMADECEFRVVTRDRDLGDIEPFRGVAPRSLSRLGKTQVMYIRSRVKDWWWVRKEIKAWRPDAYYFNSVHSPFSTIVPLALLRLHLLPKVKTVVIAPRGELGFGALSLKSRKKSSFKPMIRWLIPADVIWHASSPDEVEQIKSWVPSHLVEKCTFVVAPDPAIEPVETASTGPMNQRKFSFASRIDRMKGLDRANRVIAIVGQDMEFTWNIQGSVSDQKYLLEIEEQLTQMPERVKISRGEVFSPGESQGIFAESTAFIFPTLGENFGHVIAEALSVGCPVIVTANTPWTELILSGAGEIIESDEQAAAQLRAWAELTHEDQIALRESIHLIYKQWFELHKKVSNPFAVIYPNIDWQ